MWLHETVRVDGVERQLIGRVTRTPLVSDRSDSFLLIEDGASSPDAAGYLGLLAFGDSAGAEGAPIARGLRQLGYLDDGDVVAVDPKRLRTRAFPAGIASQLHPGDRAVQQPLFDVLAATQGNR